MLSPIGVRDVPSGFATLSRPPSRKVLAMIILERKPRKNILVVISARQSTPTKNERYRREQRKLDDASSGFSGCPDLQEQLSISSERDGRAIGRGSGRFTNGAIGSSVHDRAWSVADTPYLKTWGPC